MTYKAIKVVTIGDKTFNPGDIFPIELVEDRLIRGRKIEAVEAVEVITEDVKPKKSKKIKEVIEEVEEVEELLIDDSAEVEVETTEE
jgi:hypothetical protein